MAPKRDEQLASRSSTPAKCGKAAPKEPEAPGCPIIGIVASAGGLEALEGFFAHMPQDVDAAFVVIQHRDPRRKSLLGDLLRPYTELVITEIEDGMRPEKGRIYLNPPNHRASLFNRTFVLFQADRAVSAADIFHLHLKKILLLIRSRTGNDFSGCKNNTIRRRIERRMALNQQSRIQDCFRLVEQNPAEVDTLFKDLLIGVTNFFRDPQAFETPAHKGLPELLKNKEPGSLLRVWVPGAPRGRRPTAWRS